MKHIRTKSSTLLVIATAIFFISFSAFSLKEKDAQIGRFNKEKDLLLVQFDCKTDVDDLHTAAGLAMLMANSSFSKINYHAVAGTYGIQGGLYVPPNNLFQLAFNNNWTDAHNKMPEAVQKVKALVKKALDNKGDIWIADAGQSDFTAALIKAIQIDLPKIDISERFHVVQHSNWNEKSTAPENLEFVKANADYHKIPDGNAVGNGTPGFLDSEFSNWKSKLTDSKMIEIWQLAVDIANEFNGKEGRYNNKAVTAGGLDFSDLSEVCWIFGLEDIKDVEEFFELYSK